MLQFRSAAVAPRLTLLVCPQRVRFSSVEQGEPWSEAELAALQETVAVAAPGSVPDFAILAGLLPGGRTTAQCVALFETLKPLLCAEERCPPATLSAFLTETAAAAAAATSHQEPSTSQGSGDVSQAAAVPRVVGRRTPVARRAASGLSAGDTAALLVSLSPADGAATQPDAMALAAPAARGGAGHHELRPVTGATPAHQPPGPSLSRPPLPPPPGSGRKRVRNLFGKREEEQQQRSERSGLDALLALADMSAGGGGGGGARAGRPAPYSYAAAAPRSKSGGGGSAQKGSGSRGGEKAGRARSTAAFRQRRRKPAPERPPVRTTLRGAAAAASAAAALAPAAPASPASGASAALSDVVACSQDAHLLVPGVGCGASGCGARDGEGDVGGISAQLQAPGHARVCRALCRSARARRWAACEWFHPPVDAAFLRSAQGDAFAQWLQHVGLAGVSRLRRAEWRLVRAPLGRPRRLSLAFLREQREALEGARAVARAAYEELKTIGRLGGPACGFPRGALPPQVPPPLAVGDRVLAVHPRSRGVHPGSLLTVDARRLRVRFDRLDLGSEAVRDTDVAAVPLGASAGGHGAGGAPCAAGGAHLALRSHNHPASTLAALSPQAAPAAARALYGSDAPEAVAAVTAVAAAAAAAARGAIPGSPQEAAHAAARAVCSASHAADASCLAALASALERKEALLTELRAMNAEAASAGAPAVALPESFQRAYAAMVLALRTANEGVEAGLNALHARKQFHDGGTGGGAQRQLALVHVPGHALSANAEQLARIGGGVRGGAVRDGGATAHPGGGGSASTAARMLASARDDAAQLVAGACAGGDKDGGGDGFAASQLVSSCVAALLLLRSLSDAPGALPRAAVAGALEAAAAALRPKAHANHPLYQQVLATLAEIQEQLITAYA